MSKRDLTNDKLGPAKSMDELRARLTDLVANGTDDQIMEAASALDFGNMLLEGARQSVAMGTHKCGGITCDSDHYSALGMVATLNDPSGVTGSASALGRMIGGNVGHLQIQITPMTDEDYADFVAMTGGLGGEGDDKPSIN